MWAVWRGIESDTRGGEIETKNMLGPVTLCVEPKVEHKVNHPQIYKAKIAKKQEIAAQ